jgi:predicted dehydrogenase
MPDTKLSRSDQTRSPRLSRRYFFYGALLAGTIPAGGFGSTLSLKRLGYRSPNEKLNLAAIGVGGRGLLNIQACDSENIVAFADCDPRQATNMYQWYEKVPHYIDFRKMLDKEGNNIDAVIITIPDHGHAYTAMRCMERGKHVYLEKPLTRTVWEARLLTEAAAKFKVATQMGNQGYSSEGSRIAAEIIWSGEIGDVTEVHAWTDRPNPYASFGMNTVPPEEQLPKGLDWDMWLGPAAMRPYSSAYLPFDWRAFFDFGSGALGDIACHLLGSVHMALRLGAPTSIEAVHQEGKNACTFPKRSETHFQFPARGAMPPVKIIWNDGIEDAPYWPPGIPEDEPLVGGNDAFGGGEPGLTPGAPTTTPLKVAAAPSRRNLIPKMKNSSAAVFVGTKGYLTTDTYGANVRLLPLSRHTEYTLPPKVLTRSPGHYADWIRACKGIEPAACSNFAVAGPFTEIVQLAAVALHFEGKLEWDGAKMRFTNNPAANEFLRPKVRKGWEIV